MADSSEPKPYPQYPKPKPSRQLLKVFFIVADFYALAMLAFLAARQLIGERWDAIALGNMFAHLFLGVCVVLLPLRLVGRARAWALLQVIPVVVLLAHYAPVLLPHGAANTDAPTLTVVSWNILDGRLRIQAAEELIANTDADVLLFQDIAPETLALILERVGDAYPYYAVQDVERRDLATLSRLPFVGDTDGDFAGRYLRTAIDWRGVPLVVYNVHLTSPTVADGSISTDYDFDSRQRELEGLLALAAGESSAVILGGDFNLTDWSAPYALLAAQYSDTQREVGFGLGLSRVITRRWEGVGIIRIDYLFHSAGLEAVEFYNNYSSHGSDHFPIVGRFVVADGQ
jgi:endonuclease/exonuclease/phosphatase (EEP) superfamily protein YafD